MWPSALYGGTFRGLPRILLERSSRLNKTMLGVKAGVLESVKWYSACNAEILL
jgi:hypothetical protein